LILHAGLIALPVAGRWRGVLIEGPSGAGKSDLALRALDLGFRLVADDRVVIWTSQGRLFGRAPDALAGLIEVRGQGVARVPPLRFSEILLSAECGASERIPAPQTTDYLGVRVVKVRIQPLEASAPAKMRRALEWLGQGPEGAYQAGFAAGVTPHAGGDSR